VSTSVIRKPRNPSRELRREANEVVREGRRVRESLNAVVKLCDRRRLESRVVNDAGFEVTTWDRMSDADVLSSLHQALTWLQTAENEMRTTRVFLERAIERAERLVR
jgi:predicted metal-dependent hydrolase